MAHSRQLSVNSTRFLTPSGYAFFMTLSVTLPWAACKKEPVAAETASPPAATEKTSPEAAALVPGATEIEPSNSSVSDVLRVNFATASKAYAKNCAWQRMVPSDMEGEPETTACEYLSFDQNCEELSTCGQESEQCKTACVKGCSDCDSICTPPCTGCKKKCGKNAACIEQCATDRASCHAQCISQKAKCENQCEGTYETCEKTFDARVKKTCPDCEAIGECSQSEQRETCEKPFRKKNPTECFEWCFRQ